MSLFDAIASSANTITQLGWNIGSSLYNDYRARKATARSQSYEREMAEWQNQKNLEFWQLNNEYNTPANQMKRFEEAGLNPHLIYGNGTSSAGNSSAPVSSARPGSVDFSRPPLGDIGLNDSFSAYLAVRNLERQDAIAQSQVDFNKAKAEESRSVVDFNKAKGLNELFRYGVNKEVRSALVSQVYADLALTRSKDVTEVNNAFNVASQTRLNEQRVKESIASTQLLSAKFKMQPLEAALLSSKITSLSEQIVAQQFGNKLNAATYDAQVGKANAVFLDAFYRSQNGEVDLDMKKFERRWLDAYGSKPGTAVWNAVGGLFGRVFQRSSNFIVTGNYE